MLKFIISLLLFVCSISYGEFVLDSLTEAKELAQLTKQNVLVIFGSDDCAFCQKLKTDLSDKLMSSVDTYIVCYIDLKTQPDMKEEFKVSVIPDSIIFISDSFRSKYIGYNKETYEKWLIKNK